MHGLDTIVAMNRHAITRAQPTVYNVVVHTYFTPPEWLSDAPSRTRLAKYTTTNHADAQTLRRLIEEHYDREGLLLQQNAYIGSGITVTIED